MVLGLQRYSRKDLENVVAAGEKLQIHVLGLATIDDDVTPRSRGRRLPPSRCSAPCAPVPK